MPRRRYSKWWHCYECGANCLAIDPYACMYCGRRRWGRLPVPQPQLKGQQAMWMFGRVDGDLVDPDAKQERIYELNQLLILADSLRAENNDEADVLERSRRRETVLRERGIDPNPANYRFVPHARYLGMRMPTVSGR